MSLVIHNHPMIRNNPCFLSETGFFSCCSIKLYLIVEFINLHKKLPTTVDSSKQFIWYKKHNDDGDITYEYFQHPDNIENIDIDIEFNENTLIDYHHEHQFQCYYFLDYKNICPIVQKFFSPSQNINMIIQKLESKYNLDYENICALFYRGNDKNTETKICDYDEYIKNANLIINKNPNIQFLVQSDETEFIELMIKTFPSNSFYFNDEIRHIHKCNSTVDILFKQHNFLYSKYYLAITIIMSKAKYIVCGSGNCSIWILFYRENAKNVFQNLNGTWIEG